MSGGGSDRRRMRGKFRREVDGRAIVPAMYPRRSAMDRPEWLPEDWTMELKKRGEDCQSSNRIDRYYICPLSGKRLRSRSEVMRFLDNEILDLPAPSSPVVGRTSSLVVSRTSPWVVERTSSLLVAGERPDWLPEGWSVEFRKRRLSNTIDKYYICPLSGKKLRSRMEVMRFLNNEISDRPARSSSAIVRADIAPPMVGGHPEWLPYGWKVEYRPRRFSNYVDKYYICPSSGIKFRSRQEVMRYLNNEVPNHRASGSAKYYMNSINGHSFRSKKDVLRYLESKEVRRTAIKEKRTRTPDVFTLKEEFLPIIEYKKSKVKRTVVRKRLFGREEPDAKFEFASHSLKAASTSFGYSSALDNGASEISCLPPFQIEWHPNLASHVEELQIQPSIKTLPCSMNEKISLVGLDGERLHVPDSNLSEEEQFELTKKRSQLKSCSIGEERQKWPAIKILGDHENKRIGGALMRLEGEMLPIPDVNLLEEKKCVMRQPQNDNLSDPLMQLECKRHREVSDVNLLGKKQLEMTEKLSQLKRRIKPKRRISGKSGLKVPCDEKLLESLMQLEGNRLPVPDANMPLENKLEQTQKKTEPKRCSIGEEFEGQLASKVVQKIENENLSESPMELEYERHVVPDGNLSEVEQIEMNQPLCQLKTRSQPKRRGTGEKLQERPAILREPVNEKLSLPLRHLEGKRGSVADSNLSEDTQFELSEGVIQFKRRNQPKRHGITGKLQVLPENKMQPEPRDENLSEPLMRQEGGNLPVLDANLSSEPLMRQEGESLPVPDANLSSDPLMQQEGETLPVPDASLSEEKQIEPTQKLSQPKRRSRGGPHLSNNTEAGRSATKKQPSKRKRKAKTEDTMPIQASQPLVDVTANSVSNVGTANRSRRVKSRKIELAPSTVPEESDVSCCLHQNNACITDELQEKLERLKPFVEQASQVQQADQRPSAVPKDIHQQVAVITNELREKLERLKPFVEQASQDANHRSHQKDLPETEKVQEKFKSLQPFVEHASKEQPGHLIAPLPFGETWLDPCLEFAFKTLTSDFPVLEDVAAIQDYFSHQFISSDRTNATIGSIVESNPLAFNVPRSGKGHVKKDCQRNRRLNL